MRRWTGICGIFLTVILGCALAADKNDVNVRYLRIKSDIQSRFATTLITSRLSNPGNEAKEISFTAQLPDAAFISNFSMQIGDKIIVGDVKEKEKAKVAYEQARARGESAGLVAQKPRETNTFTITTNVAAQDKVTFNLTYQEVLKRVHGAYKHVINLQSDNLEPTSDVEIDIRIVEQGKIVNVSVPRFGAKMGEKTNSELLVAEQDPNAHITTTTTGTVTTTQVTYRPKSNGTITGQLVTLYDVQRDSNGGEIQVVNGYFVHFFAPAGLTRGSKHVVFVLDKSGSMIGKKFEQTKAAMRRILADLSEGDLFNIIMFSNSGERWKQESVRASPSNVQEAIGYINRSVADYSTNIYDPLIDALQLLNTSSSGPSSPLVSMIIFMTDGQPNAGTISNPDEIVSSITERNRESKFILHSIAFGNDADFSLVQKLSGRNFGLARKVYEDLDADVQLTGFYNEISSPLLTDVKIEYLNETVDVRSLVQDQSSENYYDGGELVTIGKLVDQAPELATFDASVRAKGTRGPVYLLSSAQTFICPRRPIITEDDQIEPCCLYPRCPTMTPMTTTERPLPGPSTVGGFVERMWAYQTIRKLLKDAELGQGNATEKKEEALRLSLKYHFVTELTSMVVVQPNNENATALKQVQSNDVITEDAYHLSSRVYAAPNYMSGGHRYKPSSRLAPQMAAGTWSRPVYAPVYGPPPRPRPPPPPASQQPPQAPVAVPVASYDSQARGYEDFDEDLDDSASTDAPEATIPSTSGSTASTPTPFYCEFLVVIVQPSNISDDVFENELGKFNAAYNTITNSTTSPRNPRCLGYRMSIVWIDREQGSNRTSLHGSSRLEFDAPTTDMFVDRYSTVWRTLEDTMSSPQMMRISSSQDANSSSMKLMLWLSNDQSNPREPQEAYDKLIDQYGYRSVGENDQELEETLRSLQMLA